MDYHLLPPLIRWEDLPDEPDTIPNNLLESDFPPDPTSVLQSYTLTGDRDSDKGNVLDFDSGSVTIFGTENGDFSIPELNLSASYEAELNSTMTTTKPMKVEVKWPKPRPRNALLSQFLVNPSTDSTEVSCVWDPGSGISNLNTHIGSNHEEQDTSTQTAENTSNTSVTVIPNQLWVLTNPRKLQSQ